MKKPKYSIVVPTRERHETLRSCLTTCLAQTLDDYEIVVVDNASSPATRDVCDSFRSPRIRHLRCDAPLSMNDNWERGLAAARGEWVTFLGDDDGLMPYALCELDRLVAEHDVKAVRWQYAIYTWPCMALKNEADRLQFLRGTETNIVDWEPALQSMMTQGGAPIPMIYYGLIHRSLIEEALRTGRVFDSHSPDYFSGVLFAALAKKYLDIVAPMSIAGLSGKSNGVAHLQFENRKGSSIAQEFAALNDQAGYTGHPELPPYAVNRYNLGALDPIFRVRDRLFPDNPAFTLSPEVITAMFLKALSPDAETRDEQCRSLRSYLADRAPDADFDALLREHQATAPPGIVILGGGQVGVHGPWEVVNTRPHGVKDIAGAVGLLMKLLDYDADIGIGGRDTSKSTVMPTRESSGSRRIAGRFKRLLHSLISR